MTGHDRTIMTSEEYAVRNQACLSEAVATGVKTALQSAVLSGAFFYGLNRYSSQYRRRFNTSAKTALFIMPIFYTSWLNIEQAMKGCADKYRPSVEALIRRQEEEDAK